MREWEDLKFDEMGGGEVIWEGRESFNECVSLVQEWTRWCMFSHVFMLPFCQKSNPTLFGYY